MAGRLLSPCDADAGGDAGARLIGPVPLQSTTWQRPRYRYMRIDHCCAGVSTPRNAHAYGPPSPTPPRLPTPRPPDEIRRHQGKKKSPRKERRWTRGEGREGERKGGSGAAGFPWGAATVSVEGRIHVPTVGSTKASSFGSTPAIPIYPPEPLRPRGPAPLQPAIPSLSWARTTPLGRPTDSLCQFKKNIYI